jgi:hypothetical protein
LRNIVVSSAAGSVHGSTVQWSFEIAPRKTAQNQTVTFAGTVDHDWSSLNGTFVIGGRQGDFEARRE